MSPPPSRRTKSRSDESVQLAKKRRRQDIFDHLINENPGTLKQAQPQAKNSLK